MKLAMITAIVGSLALIAAQGPGNGVSKTTYSSSQPWEGMSFVQKYFPTTCAEDSGDGDVANMGSETIQGRSQLTLAGQFTERNCELYSAASDESSDSSVTSSMTAPASKGKDCAYSKKKSFGKSTLMHKVYAHTADQCCKACAAVKGCVAATCTKNCTASGGGGPDFYNMGGANRRLLQGPQSYEGFGLHLVDVTGSKTTGGIDVATLESHYTARLTMEKYDAFMDYNVVLFAGDELPAYAKAMAADNVKFLSASWKASSGDTWYSVIVHVPSTQMVIELVGASSPGAEYESAMATLEARMSPRQIKRFGSKKAGGILEAVSVNRACSNISVIEQFYTNAIKAKTVHTVDAAGVSRRCFEWTDADSDVCFTSRSATVAYDSTFSVFDFEKMLWSAHKALITDVNVVNDKYNDNHYAVDTMMDGSYITTWFEKHNSSAFPINFPTTFFAWDCMQEYIIDPTGWSIQSDYTITLPGCTDRTRKRATYAKFTADAPLIDLPVY